MKKRLILLCLVLGMLLAGCGGEPEPEQTLPTEEPSVTTTVMVYMIGSDLEAKSGAATADLEEMAASGVDLTNNNILVYAAGSPYWHNEVADPECNTVLQLTDAGFVARESYDSVSMGDAQTLADFLTYAQTQYPADRYALILWDHGNGPLMGYGKDLLYNSDALLLEEMAQAAEKAGFGPENKLNWVGFDACLMSSAELVCLWGDYADYLVASQETEPSIGWDYSFLKELGGGEVPQLLTGLTECYLAACEAYYQERGYKDRDTTLSCMDLSHAEELSAAIDGLFAAASEDVEQQYNLLAVQRVQTRALGRASTGSEYDLVDLQDVAVQLEELYPTEAAQLQEVLEEMVVANATNAQGCCGLSLYYPFFNKYYYENGWEATYESLGLFPAYRQYLSAYRQTWLGSDKLEQFAQSVMPREESQGVYILPLTKDQQETFVSARYFILEKDGDNLYTRVYASSDVTNVDGLLVANFDGNILYANSNAGDSAIPVLVEHDTVGDVTRYSMHIRATNLLTLWGLDEDEEHIVSDYRYYLTKNNQTGEVSISALLPYTFEADADAFSGTKTDVTLEGMKKYIFLREPIRYLARYDNGAIMPYNSWPDNGWSSGWEWAISNGLEFSFGPAEGGEYYLIFEIQDTQGNSYCSELLAIDVPIEPTYPEQLPTTTVQWSSGDRVLLKEADGVKMYLKTDESWGELSYTLEVENTGEETVYIDTGNALWNGDLKTGSFYGALTVLPGETAQPTFGATFGLAADVGDLTVPETLDLEIEMVSGEDGRVLWPKQRFRVELSGEAAFPVSGSFGDLKDLVPCRDAFAEEQVVLEQDGLRVTLVSLGMQDGSSYYDGLRQVYKVENTTDELLYLGSSGIAVNDVFFTNIVWPQPIDPHTVWYFTHHVDPEQMDERNIRSIESVKIQLGVDRPNNSFYTVREMDWYDIELSQKGKKTAFPEGKEVLFEENGIRITLMGIRETDYCVYWDVAICNESEYDISMDVVDVAVNGLKGEGIDYMGLGLMYQRVGAGQCTKAEFSFYDDLETDITCNLRILTLTEDEILFTGTETVTLEKPQ